MMQLTLCADDFGQNEDISLGIIDCLERNRISATSCLSTSQAWPTFANHLTPFYDVADIGLHINFTEGCAISTKKPFAKLTKLILQSQLHLLKQSDIETEIQAQIDSFRTHIGRDPDFLDGHQHVHQFPVIRDAMIAVYTRCFTNRKPYIRIPKQARAVHASERLKLWLITHMGSHRLQRKLEQLQIPHNLSFSGIYDFNYAKDYANIFPAFMQQLKQANAPLLCMCHPGRPSQDHADPIANARSYEYHYLLSDKFLDDCQQHALQLARIQSQ